MRVSFYAEVGDSELRLGLIFGVAYRTVRRRYRLGQIAHDLCFDWLLYRLWLLLETLSDLSESNFDLFSRHRLE